jgi:hypothetical protein
VASASADPEMMVIAAVALAPPPLPPFPPPPLPTPLPPAPPFPPVAVALFNGKVTGCALPALAETDSPSPPGMPGLPPSAPAAPSSPRTVTISARAPAALAIMKASDATPVINARVKIER